MKSNREMREEAWRLMWAGGWFGRFAAVSVIMGTAVALLTAAIAWGFSSSEIGTLQDFLAAQQRAASQGLSYAPSNDGDLLRMVGASFFQSFIQYLLTGIALVGSAAVTLQAVRGVRNGWLVSALSGFAAPFAQFWLMFGLQVRTVLWLLAVLFPAGVVAGMLGGGSLASLSAGALVMVLATVAVMSWLVYRYLLVWYLRVDHPDWSAGRCIGESVRAMTGWKWRAVGFDCSYARAFLGLIPLALAALWLVIRVEARGLETVTVGEISLAALLLLIGLVYGFVLVWYLSLGHAVFYRERMSVQDEGGLS